MRLTLIPTLVALCLTFCYAAQLAELLRFTSVATTSPPTISASIPDNNSLSATESPEVSLFEKLDLRQAPVNPALPNQDPYAAALPAAPVNPALAPALPTTTASNPTMAITAPAPTVSITVQWVETWIGGTSRTWVPRTITYRNQALSGAAPPPGKGEVGMGTLTGAIGITKTVWVGAAETRGSDWKRGIVAAVGAGMLAVV